MRSADLLWWWDGLTCVLYAVHCRGTTRGIHVLAMNVYTSKLHMLFKVQ